MADDWKRRPRPVLPFFATPEECKPVLDETVRVIVSTGVCPCCDGRMVPPSEMHNGWSMHRRSCVFIQLGEHSMDLLLERMGWPIHE